MVVEPIFDEARPACKHVVQPVERLRARYEWPHRGSRRVVVRWAELQRQAKSFTGCEARGLSQVQKDLLRRSCTQPRLVGWWQDMGHWTLHSKRGDHVHALILM